MKKHYSGIEFEIVVENVFSDVLISSTPDNFVEDELYEGVLQ